MSKRSSSHRVKRNQQLIEAQRLLEGHTMGDQAYNFDSLKSHHNPCSTDTAHASVGGKGQISMLNNNIDSKKRQVDIGNIFKERRYEQVVSTENFSQEKQSQDVEIDDRWRESNTTNM